MSRLTEPQCRADKMYAEQVENVKPTIILVTAKKAEEILESNKDNRPYSPGLAARYAESILAGTFDFNGEAKIIRDRKDSQHNDQHTLHAVILAQKLFEKDPAAYPVWKGADVISVPMLAVTGIDPKTANTIDLGRTRSMADILFREKHIKGSKTVTPRVRAKLSRWLAGAVRLVWARANGDLATTRKRLTQESAGELLKEHPAIPDAVMAIYEIDTTDNDKNLIAKWISPAYAAGLLYLFATSVDAKNRSEISDRHWDKVAAFFSQFASGQGDANEPAIRARKKFEDMAGKSKDRETVCNVLCHCFNAYMAGKTVDAANLNNALKAADKAKQPIRVGGYDVVRPEPVVENEPVVEGEVVEDLSDESAAA